MAKGTTVNQRDVQTLVAAGSAQNEKEIRLPIPLLTGGMRTDKSPIDLADNEAVDILNLNLIAGDLTTDTGYGPFGSAFLGQAQQTFQVFYPDGTSDDLLVTTSTIYRYVIAAQQWQLVSFGAAYAISHGPGYDPGTAVFDLASTAGISIGSIIGVGQSDGSQIIGTVSNIAGISVTFGGGVVFTHHVNDGAPVALATTLHGDATGQKQVVMTPFPANGWVIITNCVDPIMYYFQGVVKVLPGLPANTTCFAMVVAHEQLLIANTVENGVDFPQRVRTSDQADPTNWTTGLAAIYPLLDTEDFILSLNTLGPYLIVYRETTIMRGTYLGLPNETWFWEYMIYGEGAISQGAIAEVGAEHVFVGTAGIYYYRGDYQLESIGDPIFFNFLSVTGDLNPKARGAVFCQYVGDYDEFWLFYPGENSTFPNRMLRCVLEDNSWYRRTFFDSFVSCQPRISLAEFTWATIPGTWLEHPEPWDSRIFFQNVPNFLMCSPTQSKLMMFDYVTGTDNGNVISWEFTTKQFAPATDEMARWERLTVYGAGIIDTCEYSIDEGTTWQLIGGPYVFVNDFDRVDIYIDRVTPRMQFRLMGNDINFVFRRALLRGVVESEW